MAASPTIAEEDAEACGARILSQDDPSSVGWSGVSLGGWEVVTKHAPILAEAEHEKLVRWLSVCDEKGEPISSCGSVSVRGTHLQLPEILFGNSALELRQAASGMKIRFDAWGALWHWVQLFVAGDFSVIKVPEAEQWARHTGRDAGLKHVEYDWTWATNFPGWILPNSPDTDADLGGPDRAAQAAAAAAMAAASGSGTSAPAEAGEGGATSRQPPPLQPQPPRDTGLESVLPRWEAEQESGVDRAMLSDRQAPILMYDDVRLFEDFVHDHGCVSFGVKVRVMPRCWFVLLRYWLRIDGVVLKVFDTRYFHRFGDYRVHREITRLEATFAQLAAAGSPTSPGYYDDPQKALPFLRPASGFERPVCHSLELGRPEAVAA